MTGRRSAMVMSPQEPGSDSPLTTTVNGSSFATISGTAARKRFPSGDTSKAIHGCPFSSKRIVGAPSRRDGLVRIGTDTSRRSAER